MIVSARQIKRRHYARAAWSNPYMPHPFQQEGDPFDDGWDEEDQDDQDDYACTHCGGEGYREVDDPLWDDCDEFGYGRYVAGYSGREDDGNACIWEECDCFIPAGTAGVKEDQRG